MLDPVAKLAKYVLWHVGRRLRYEINANTLGPDQAGDLLHLIYEGLWRVVKQQVGLVKEEHQLGFVRITNLWQFLKQFGQQPQKESRIKARRSHQLVSRQNVHHSPPVSVTAHQVRQLQRRFAKQLRAALIFQHQQAPLDRANGGGRDIAVAQRQFGTVFTNPDQQCLKILQIKQRQTFFIGQSKGDVQDTLLRLAQLQQPSKQQRPHFCNGGPYGMALLSVEIPECHWRCVIAVICKPDLGRTFHKGTMQFMRRAPRFGEAGQIPLNVRQDHRDARVREAFRQDLQGDCFAGASCAGDQAVAVGVFQGHLLRFSIRLAAASDENGLCHGCLCSFEFGLSTLCCHQSCAEAAIVSMKIQN